MRVGGTGDVNRAVILASSLVLAAVALVAACGESGTAPLAGLAATATPAFLATDVPTATATATATRVPPTATPHSRPPTPTPTPPPRPTTVTVDIVNDGSDMFKFSPQSVTIKVGTTVKWVNMTSVIHTSTRTSGPASWDSKTINSGGTFSFTFAVPGTYTYECVIHTGMTGTIVVTK